MANIVLKQLEGGLEPIPGTVASGDTVQNGTTGLLTLVKGKEEAVGNAIVIKEIAGTEILVAPGATSPALTFAVSESYYIKDFGKGMSTTVPTVVV